MVSLTTNEQPTTIPNQLSVIENGQFRRALFTTFTLTLSFFESYVLPLLHRASCNDVTILVDERFYAESLAESRSRYIGMAYRLLPVRMVGGVFHAKLTYLWSESEPDVLMVGSGNLTIAGWGRQLECLQVLQAHLEPTAFDDFAILLDELLVCPRVRLGGAEGLIDEFSKRARNQSQLTNSGSENPVRLLSSINKPISSAIIERLEGFGPFEELVALSPFHDGKARPLLKLAKAVGAAKVKIALDGRNLSTPVVEGVVNVDFVLREPADDRRPTHAKWYEFRGRTSWLLAGSVNATHTSIETTDNFEVASFHRVDQDGLPTWNPATPVHAGVTPKEFDGSGNQHVLTAEIGSGEIIRGSFLEAAGTDGCWSTAVLVVGTPITIGTVTVRSGSFTCQGPAAIAEGANPCQLVLERGDERAGCWLMFPLILSMSHEQRDFARRLRKLHSPDADEDDYVNVLAWLAERLGSVLN